MGYIVEWHNGIGMDVHVKGKGDGVHRVRGVDGRLVRGSSPPSPNYFVPPPPAYIPPEEAYCPFCKRVTFNNLILSLPDGFNLYECGACSNPHSSLV